MDESYFLSSLLLLVFSRSSESNRYISPVEKSHQIMEQVHVEWQKEQERIAREKAENEKREKEREKMKGTENTDLSAPNKLSNEHQLGKNLTAKQKAALIRQQKLAKAKSVTNKALKKSSEGKSSKSARNSSKNGKNRSSRSAKQTKEKDLTNVNSSEINTLGVEMIVDMPIQGATTSTMTPAETGTLVYLV